MTTEYCPVGSETDDHIDIYYDLGYSSETIKLSATLKSIDGYLEAERLDRLSKDGSKSLEVQRRGGVRKCIEDARRGKIAARTEYLNAHGYPVDIPKDSSQYDAYSDGVRAWVQLRTIIEDEANCQALREYLQESLLKNSNQAV